MQSEHTAPLRYRGRDRNGQGITGAGKLGESAATLAERLYGRRVQSATITKNGHEVGGVGPLDGKRTWWGEL